MAAIDPALMERLDSKIQTSASCWTWTAALTKDGYGRFADGKGGWNLAHRVLYELVAGPIPSGLVIDHLCRNRSCVNPDHLEVVTPGENTKRGTSFSTINAAKTHCPHGHPYSGDNLYIRPEGGRKCRTCNIEAGRKFRAGRNN